MERGTTCEAFVNRSVETLVAGAAEGGGPPLWSVPELPLQGLQARSFLHTDRSVAPFGKGWHGIRQPQLPCASCGSDCLLWSPTSLHLSKRLFAAHVKPLIYAT